MTDERTVAYGAWPSPITAVQVAASGLRLDGGRFVGEEVWWTEGRPGEGGRQAVVAMTADGSVRDILPAPWNARTRVHEYGGSCWTPIPFGAGHSLVFSHFTDQRLYILHTGESTATPISPVPEISAGMRYAEPTLSPDGSEIWAVLERHTDSGIERGIVAIPLDGSATEDPALVREIVMGHDFFGYPTPSPGGRKLAWICWDHPRMPWDGTELQVGDIDRTGAVSNIHTILGGADESVLAPVWASEDALYAATDASGWWNIVRVSVTGGGTTVVTTREEEFAGPLWSLGTSWYAVLADGRIAVTHGTSARRLGILDPVEGTLRDLDLPFTSFAAVSARETDVLALGMAANRPTTLIMVPHADPDEGVELLRTAESALQDVAYLPEPYPITAAGVGGRDVHAWVYPPRNPAVRAPDGELPPFIVTVHGGPTSQASVALSLSTAYFTSRGVGVLDVDYGGSTGYGRAYRERLRGQWGVVDVEDCVSAVQALVGEGLADPARLAIRGGSAGGWTTLAALTNTDVFAAGVSYYGVAELERFVADTHDFESRYLDGLIGPLPEAADLYRERAPLSHVADVSCPVLLLQGSEDLIVPPSQAQMFADALRDKGIPYAYLLFDGEQHGFRRAENQIAALEAELSFYGQVFGFIPPDVPVLALRTG